MGEVINFIVKWSAKEYTVECSKEKTFLNLKEEIQKQTGVKPERQKLLNVKASGQPCVDTTKLSETNIINGFKIMMMGSLEESIKDASTKPLDTPEIVDDFYLEEENDAIENKDIYLAKIDKRIQDYKINVLNEPRPGKKLLVLDIDYTLFDHRSAAEQGYELMRPFLHEFLKEAYEDYDIAIWSATSMKWIEEKMKLLGVSSNPDYKIVFNVDCNAMISVHLPRQGVVEVKPLGVIWGKFPQYTPKNTIMFDDIRRNFLMNPNNGLRIKPFREAHLNRSKDDELQRLAVYLKDIADLDDFSHLDHKDWEKYVYRRERKRRRQEQEQREREERKEEEDEDSMESSDIVMQ